jgi:hypothetical protein
LKKSYHPPTLAIHGDFVGLTRALQGGPGFDGAPYPVENPFHKCGTDQGEHYLDPDCRSL